jgi:hypothetical protein
LGSAKRTLGNVERGTHPPSLALRRALNQALDHASDAQRARFFTADHNATPVLDGEHDALELNSTGGRQRRRHETLSRLELAVDDLATRYPSTPTAELLTDVRRDLGYVMHLVEAPTTLREHHRLLVIAGWLSLLAAILDIDLDDPDKALAYTATTLAWIGDPAAESYAREVISRLSAAQDVSRRPRRIALAQLDLVLALLASDRPDEASAAALDAMLSGWVVPSNHWRAREVVTAVEARGLSEAADLREAYTVMRRG